MLGDVKTIDTVSSFLASHTVPVLVIDPVTIASSGDRLLTHEAEDALRQFTEMADVITPNIPELALLAKTEVPRDEDEAVAVAKKFAETTGTVVTAAESVHLGSWHRGTQGGVNGYFRLWRPEAGQVGQVVEWRGGQAMARKAGRPADQLP